jgi:crossover junction endodeoxyribonuclease RusA
MTEWITFTVHGSPVPKARHRLGKGNVYTPQRTKDAEAAIAWHAKIAMAGRKPHQGPVNLCIMFAMPSKKATARPDIDNLIKTVMDALNGVAYVDDCQITNICASKHASRSAGTQIDIGFEP